MNNRYEFWSRFAGACIFATILCTSILLSVQFFMYLIGLFS